MKITLILNQILNKEELTKLENKIKKINTYPKYLLACFTRNYLGKDINIKVSFLSSFIYLDNTLNINKLTELSQKLNNKTYVIKVKFNKDISITDDYYYNNMHPVNDNLGIIYMSLSELLIELKTNDYNIFNIKVFNIQTKEYENLYIPYLNILFIFEDIEVNNLVKLASLYDINLNGGDNSLKKFINKSEVLLTRFYLYLNDFIISKNLFKKDIDKIYFKNADIDHINKYNNLYIYIVRLACLKGLINYLNDLKRDILIIENKKNNINSIKEDRTQNTQNNELFNLNLLSNLNSEITDINKKIKISETTVSRLQNLEEFLNENATHKLYFDSLYDSESITAYYDETKLLNILGFTSLTNYNKKHLKVGFSVYDKTYYDTLILKTP